MDFVVVTFIFILEALPTRFPGDIFLPSSSGWDFNGFPPLMFSAKHFLTCVFPYFQELTKAITWGKTVHLLLLVKLEFRDPCCPKVAQHLGG